MGVNTGGPRAEAAQREFNRAAGHPIPAPLEDLNRGLGMTERHAHGGFKSLPRQGLHVPLDANVVRSVQSESVSPAQTHQFRGSEDTLDPRRWRVAQNRATGDARKSLFRQHQIASLNLFPAYHGAR